ncbi:MAG: carbohydrate kinase [Granulosicoccaceae bacterium]
MFLSCGDSLFDLFVEADSEQAEKVSLNGGPGGSPMNVAFGLARLGNKSSFLSPISNDLYAKRLREFLSRNKVDLSLCPQTDRNTTLAIIEKNQDGSAEYVFYLEGAADTGLQISELPNPLPATVKFLHFGSYSTVIEPTASALKQLAKQANGKALISYDPNLRLSIQPSLKVWKETFEHFTSVASVVKASDEDIAGLFGVGGEDEFVEACLKAGSELVFITRGPDGGSAFSNNGAEAHSRGYKVDVVDTVGAGDTFQAFLLHYLGQYATGSTVPGIAEIDLATCLDTALKAAAITCTRHGADLPTFSDLD